MDTQIQNSYEEDVIKRYLYDGYSHCEILCFLAKYHNISISLRQLHKILRKYGLFKRKNYSSLNKAVLALKMLLKESGSSLGYKRIHQKLRQLGYFVDEETVRLCLKILVPSVVELGICRRLQRRAYLSPGPDHTWHTDGYDKLKPYEFARHGAINGYSRKILWLYVSASNNNSSNIAFYFLQTITELNRIPQVVRGDRSSENVTVCGVQRFLRRDFDDILSGQASFWCGSSTPNQ